MSYILHPFDSEWQLSERLNLGVKNNSEFWLSTKCPCALYIFPTLHMLETIYFLKIHINLIISFTAHVIFLSFFFVSVQVMPWPRADQDSSTRKRIQNETPWNPKWVCFCLYFIFYLYCPKWVWQWHELYPKWSLVLSASLTLSGEGESVIWQQLWPLSFQL